MEGKTESEVEKYLLALRVSQFDKQTAAIPVYVLIGYNFLVPIFILRLLLYYLDGFL